MEVDAAEVDAAEVDTVEVDTLETAPPRRPASPEGRTLGWTAVALAILLAVLLAGCFEDRVEERLLVGLEPGGGASFFYSATFHDIDGHGEKALERVLDLQRRLEDGSADWPRAVGEIPSAGLVGREVRFDEDGRMESFEAWSRTRDARTALPRLLSHTSVQAQVTVEAGFVEVSLRPGRASRATRRQRQRLDRDLREWSRRVSAYLLATTELWRALERSPERRRPLLGALFDDVIDSQDAPELSPVEEELVEAVLEAEAPVLEIFETGDGDAHTLQELSRLVHDPYGVELVLALAGDDGRAESLPPVTWQGLVDRGDGTWSVPRASLWDAFLSLEGRWLSPDPLAAKIRHLRTSGDQSDFDLDFFEARTFSVEHAPLAAVVLESLEDALEPPAVSHIAWRIPDEGPS